MLLKKIVSYGFIEGLGKGLNKLNLVLLPFFISTFDYGKVGLLISLEMVLPFITLLGFERAVTRFYARKQDFTDFSHTISRSVFWAHAVLLAVLGIVYALGVRSFFGLDLFPDLFLIVLLIYFQGTNLITLESLRASENHKVYFRARLFTQVVKFALVIGLSAVFKSYLCYIVGAMVAAIATNFLFRIRKEERAAGAEKFNKRTFGLLFAFSWPFIFHGIANNFLGNADKFILERYMTLGDVGLYTLAYSIGSSVMFAYIGISIFLEPLIYKEEDILKRTRLLDKFLFLAMSCGTLAYFVLAFLSENVLPHFYGKNFEAVFGLIPLIGISFLIYPFYLRSNYKMIYDRKSLIIAVTSIFSSVVNIGLNIYLIPIYGLYAAVMTTFISYAIQASMFVLTSNKYRFNRETLEVLAVIALIAVSIFAQWRYYYVAGVLALLTGYFYYDRIRMRHGKEVK